MTLDRLQGMANPGDPLWRALAISIALHVALLSGIPDLWTHSPPPTEPITAWIEPAANPHNEQFATQAEAQPQLPRSERTQRARSTPPRTISATRVVTPPTTGSAQTDSLASAVSSKSALSPDEAMPDFGSPAQYRLALIGAARHDKPYPLNALDRGWQGKVAVRLVIGADGELAGTQVTSSSGYAVLDWQAVETLKRAQ